ncbi:hypothetical protein ACFY1B_38295 [Streptomyces mirabilis]|uniref:hypothetical protein n=1 Tax=Streptomyces mirabilis TaxID=68239 RepID=UPI0036AC9AEE
MPAVTGRPGQVLFLDAVSDAVGEVTWLSTYVSTSWACGSGAVTSSRGSPARTDPSFRHHWDLSGELKAERRVHVGGGRCRTVAKASASSAPIRKPDGKVVATDIDANSSPPVEASSKHWRRRADHSVRP